MKTFYLNATPRRLLLLCLLAITCFSSLTAQDTTATRMHEVGLQISNFNLENFGLVYKIQRPGQENRYIRYRFIVGDLSFGTGEQSNSLDYDVYTIGLGAAIGFESRTNLGAKIQFIQGPELSPFFSFTKNDTPTTKQQNIGGTIRLGYVLGLQYNINDAFYINLEATPGLSFYYNESKQSLDVQNFRETKISNFNVSGNFNSDNIALTFAYRFRSA
jgi:hypothetical protein